MVLAKGGVLLYMANKVTICGTTTLADGLARTKTRIGIVLDRSTTGFMTPLAFRTLSERSICASAFSRGSSGMVTRVSLTS